MTQATFLLAQLDNLTFPVNLPLIPITYSKYMVFFSCFNRIWFYSSAICTSFRLGSSQTSLYVALFQAGHDFRTCLPYLRKNAFFGRIFQDSSKKVLLTKLLKANAILNRFMRVNTFFARPFQAIHFLQDTYRNLPRNLLFGRLLRGIHFLTASHKILQDSAKKCIILDELQELAKKCIFLN